VAVPFVLCYHAVSDTWDHPLAVRRETLKRQLAAAIRWGWKPAGAAEIVAGKPRALHATFDDGYRSILSVLPALEQLGLRPTVFVCTDYASEGRPLELPPLDRLPAHRNELATLRWDELRELAERGVEIASHTRTHPNLRELSTDDVRREVTESRDEIESEVGRRCSYFGYPYGQFDARVRDEVDRAGYEAAFGLLGVGPLGGRFGVSRVESSRRDGDVGILLKGSPAWPLLAGASRRLRGARARVSR
jgi:peptidoglycan/xylan/chitin deacetylase (PgdA/CDA1 family)